MTALYSNIQSNEKLRNNLFALYIAITAALFGFTDSALISVQPSIQTYILPGLVWIAGILFLGAFIRYKEMIRRDFDLAINLQLQIYKRHPVLFDLFTSYCDYNNAKHKRITSVSTTLILLTFAIVVIALSSLIYSILSPQNQIINTFISASISFFINLLIFFFYGGSANSFSDKVSIKISK